MPDAILHIEPTARGRWTVRGDDDREPRSEHDSASEAQRAARDLRRREESVIILLHDRYARVHRV